MFSTILVPVDGSASADGALRLALRLVAPGGDVVIAHVIDRAKVLAECVTPYGGDPTPALQALEEDEREMFARVCARASDAGIHHSTVSLDGRPVSSIVALARERKVDAIAMGTHGRHGIGRLFLGNTALGVLLQTSVPTFVVHELDAELAGAPFKKVLAAFDMSAAAAVAARAAVDLAANDDGSVFFARVAAAGADEDDANAFSQAAAYALSAGVPSDNAVLFSDAVDAILDSAATCHANLIVIGAHGEGKRVSRVAGALEAVVRASPVPVLVVPSGDWLSAQRNITSEAYAQP